MAAVTTVVELTSLLEAWDRENGSGADPIPTLTRMAELIEKETESWYKMDPDPFDDRHPGRADPDCALGHMLKAIFKNDNFMSKLVSNYLMSNRDNTELNTVASRLLLDIMPGLEISVFFVGNEGLVRRLISWAETAPEPLRSYALGLLASAMEVQDIATNFRENNTALVPQMLRKLKDLQVEQLLRNSGQRTTFADISQLKEDLVRFTQPEQPAGGPGLPVTSQAPVTENGHASNGHQEPGQQGDHKFVVPESPGKKCNGDMMSPPAMKSPVTPQKNGRSSGNTSPRHSPRAILFQPLPSANSLNEQSQSSWADMEHLVIGTTQMYPLTIEMQQRLIIQYLTPMVMYQEFLGPVFEHNTIELIFKYIDLKTNRDVRLAFDALKLLSALLCHKKFALEFIAMGGVQQLLAVQRPSVAATGVSICIYYFAYFEDAMEKVCALPHSMVSELVEYALWLLECSHESGRCHAVMFFTFAFPYRIILDLFDQQDGLRKLFNVMSMLPIMSVEGTGDMTDDDVFTNRQAARHTCVALKRYFEAHMAIKADQIRRTHLRHEGGGHLVEMPAYKATKVTPDVVQGNIELLLECLPLNIHWKPISQFLQLDGITLLLQLVAMAAKWSAYNGKAETVRSALDALAVCSVMPKTLLQLCESVSLPENVTISAISILLGLAEGDVLRDADVQRAALNVICNAVCGPSARYNGSIGRIVDGSARKLMRLKNGEDLLAKMWGTVRANDGIMVLLKLLMIKSPITAADSIRALACKALVGLARSDTVTQIIGKLPLFNNGQLQQLMKYPVLEDKRQDHLKFCTFASQLIERVSGKPSHANVDASIDRIRRADVIAQTKIIYNEKELLQLIHDHLLKQGLTQTAAVLQSEGGLPRISTPTQQHPESPLIYATSSTSSPSTPKLGRQLTAPGTPHTPVMNPRSRPTPGSTAGPIRLNVINSKTASPMYGNQTRINFAQLQQNRRIIKQKQEAASSLCLNSPLLAKSTCILKPDSDISLNRIVTEYLRKQHASCENPVSTCPPFSLLTPHRCPNPKRRITAPTNILSRIFKRTVTPRFGGPSGEKFQRKFIYSRYSPVRSYRESADEEGSFSTCAFSSDENYLMLGTQNGEVKLYNVQTAEEMTVYMCHTSPVTHIEAARDGKTILTSGTWSTPLTALWSMGDFFEMLHNFDEITYAEYSKQTQDRLVGTKDDQATIFDLEMGRSIVKMYDAEKSNHYSRNRATFNNTDDLVLNDGVLWDAHNAKVIHKFDKFNPHVSGVFHPMGLEIIINSEVWDLRTFHLLHTVPALDQCDIKFNHNADVIYGAHTALNAVHSFNEDEENDPYKSPFNSSFRTFDARDYSNIATIDVRKTIFDLCTDSSDCYLAVVENTKVSETMAEESVCRLYEVGKLKEEDEVDDEDEDEEVEEDDDDDDDGSNLGDWDSDDDENQDEDNDNDEDGSGDDDGSNSDDDDSDSGSDDLDDDDDDEDDDDDMDNMFFELSDTSNMGF